MGDGNVFRTTLAFIALFILCFSVFTVPAVAAGAEFSGQVADEAGAPVAGAEVTLVAGAPPGAGSEAHPAPAVLTDEKGHFTFTALAPGAYLLSIRKKGFFALENQSVLVGAGANSEETYTLTPEKEVHEQVEVSTELTRIEPEDTTQRSTVQAKEIQDVPVPTNYSLSESLAIMPDVVRDNSGAMHVAGSRQGEVLYLLDGFEISDPVTGAMNVQFNVDATTGVEVQSGRVGSGNAHAGAGMLSVDTVSGDDNWRVRLSAFVPGAETEGGLRLGNWTPQFQFSGPIVRGKLWFSNAVSVQRVISIVKVPVTGPDHSTLWGGQDLLRLQWNVSPRHTLAGSYLYNRDSAEYAGLDAIHPYASTLSPTHERHFATLKDQMWISKALIELGIAADSGVTSQMPEGSLPYIQLPTGASGNYYEQLRQRGRRVQGMASVTFAAVQWHGRHDVAAGFSAQEVALSQSTQRGAIQDVRADGTLARLTTFTGNPVFRVSDTLPGVYAQDTWVASDRLVVQAGVRKDWDRILQSSLVSPHVAVNIMPFKGDSTKISLGWNVTATPMTLAFAGRAYDQGQVDTYYDATGLNVISGPVTSKFVIPGGGFQQPHFEATSISWQQKIGANTAVTIDLLAREGFDQLHYEPQGVGGPVQTFVLLGDRRDRYRAATISARHTFSSKAEIFGSYARSRASSSEVIDPTLGSLLYAPLQSGAVAWDTPNRLTSWGWTPTKIWGLFLSYSVEYRTGYPFSSVDQYHQLFGTPNALRYPDYATVNIGFEKYLSFMNRRWAFRVTVANILGRDNFDVVSNNASAADYLTFLGGHGRTVWGRLRLVGKK
jgi:hypothetical protein